MAKNNFTLMYGQVRAKPRLRIDDGEPKQATFSIKVLRRPSNGQGFDSKLYADCPVIRTKNKEMIKKICELDVGDMVLIRGTLTTKEVLKRAICPQCGKENKAHGNIVYITPIMIRKEEAAQNETEGIALLKEYNEISNLVEVIGTLCREPHFYIDANNRKYAQYQIAVNRRYRIHEDPDDKKTDYPWIKTFGLQAAEDSKCLAVGSTVYISGALQTREILRTMACEHCSHDYEWDETVAEIVPYYIGYIANCNTSTDGTETSETEAYSLNNVDMNEVGNNGEEKGN